MINGEINVPENKIAVIPTAGFDLNELDLFIRPLKGEKKRKWFDSHFYRCLPLTIGNQQGFVVYSPFPFSFYWNGGNKKEDITFMFKDEDLAKYEGRSHFRVDSHFGYGIITLSLPVIFRTPPGINLMTIAPPNYPLPNISPMTGVVETDNLRTIFTFNLKVSMADITINVDAGTPLAAFIPVPRYFVEKFDLVSAYDIFPEEVVNQESLNQEVYTSFRKEKQKTDTPFDKLYMHGQDYFGNKFVDHQKNIN
jgi:hypothetical protein